MAKHWRQNLKQKEVPPKEELLSRFDNLIESIVDVVINGGQESSSLHFWFHKKVGGRIFGFTGACTPLSIYMVRERIDSAANLSEEDVRQQLIVNLLEIWSFYKDKIKPGKKTRFVFYDHVRFNLIKHISTWISHQILTNTGDVLAPKFSETTYIDEPSILKVNLGWVLLKSNQGPLSNLTTKQKYLLYLRYSKNLTIKEISVLTKRHRASIEKDFSTINSLLGIGGHYVNSRTRS